MTAKAKYLFDEDFSTGDRTTISVVEAERRRADAESHAYRKGFAAGEDKAKAEAAQRAANALAVMADGLDKLNKALSDIEIRVETEAVDVAVAVAGKLAPALIAREPFEEISALARDCFQHLVKTPHVVVRVGPPIYEITKDKLDEIARARGFEGRLVVMAEDNIAAGDCRIEWAEGGLARDEAAPLAVLDDAVARHLGAPP